MTKHKSLNMTTCAMMLMVAFLIIPAPYCFAQTGDSLIEWEPVQRITVDSAGSWLPNITASGSNVYLCWQDEGAKSFFTYSNDNGSSWQQSLLLTDTFPPFYNNSKFAVSDNYVYFTTWYNELTPDTSNLGIWFRRSTDYGQTWDSGRVIGDWGREAWSITAEENHVIINYEIRGQAAVEQGFAHSADYGETWEFFDARLPGNHSPEITMSGGTLYETREGAANDAAEVLFSYSADYGETWSPEIFLSTTDSLVSDLSHVAADTEGNVYVVWRDAKYGSSNGFGATVILKKSTDYGSAWQEEQVITTIPSGTFPKVSVYESAIGIAWGDEKNIDEGEVLSTHARISTDRGQTWSLEYDLSSPTRYNADQNISIEGEHVYVVWSNVDSYGNPEVLVKRGRIRPTSVSGNTIITPTDVELLFNYPNPFNNTTNIQFNISKRAQAVLELYNTLGQKVDKLMDGILSPGEYDIRWNASRFDSGMYFAVLQVDGKVLLQKIILMK